MTKRLEELLNLPDSKELAKKEEKKDLDRSRQVEKKRSNASRSIAELDKISAALPAVDGLGRMADDELNEIAERAITAYDDLMDLGMNVESRYSGRIFEVAGSMLKTGLDAKVAKLDKKLKMVELQLKKEKQDKESGDSAKGMIEGTGHIVTDRNSLLEKLKSIKPDK
jgi:hypothetical protein